MKDTDLMPFGKFKGEEMQNVPASYLIWLFENNKCTHQVRNYVVENMEVLESEIKK